MTDPRTPDDAGLPTTPAQPVDEGPDASQLDSFAAESPAEPSDAVTPPADPAPVEDGVEPAPAAATLADEEPVHPDPVPTDVSSAQDVPVVDPPVVEPGAPVESVAPEPVTPEPVTPEPVTPEPVTPEPAAPVEPVAPEPVTPEPVTPEPTAATPTAAPAALAAAAPLAAAAASPPGDAEAAAGPDAAPPPTATADTPPAEATPVPRARSRAWIPLAAIGTAVALLTAGTGFLAWEVWQESRAEQAREDAKAAARDAARVLFSYDHETLAQDFERGLSVTTGEFREQYSRTTQEVVTPVAEQYDAVVQAEVIEAAIVDAGATEVTAIVFLNQATTSTRVQGQQVDQSRVRMRLVLRDGRWLVAEVGAL